MLFGVDLDGSAADEAETGMVEVVVRPFVERDVLGDRPVPDVEVEGEERADAGACLGIVMPEVMLSDLAVVVRKSVQISFGLDSSSRRVFS